MDRGRIRRDLKYDRKGIVIENGFDPDRYRLEWWVDSRGHRLEHREKRSWTRIPADLGGSDNGAVFSLGGQLPDGDYVRPVVPSIAIPAGPCIVPNGGKDTRYRVGLGEHNILFALANTVDCSSLDDVNMAEASERALAFTDRWGFLSAPWHELPLSEFLKEAVRIRKAIEEAKRSGRLRFHRPMHLAALSPGIECDGRVLVRLRSLLAFCWWELAILYGDGNFYCCGNLQCTTFGPYPSTGRPNKYCSDRCRKAASRAIAKDGPGS
jgi:hypothetical protein